MFAPSGPWLLPHAVPLWRWWNNDVCVKARPPQAEHPEEHVSYGALQEHGQESHHRGPQHNPGNTAPEQHHVGHTPNLDTDSEVIMNQSGVLQIL